MTDTVISLRNVYKAYLSTPKKFALEDFTLEIQKGEFFCIVGPSGCGKSTVLKIISGLETPTTGQITKPENITMVFQSGALFPWMSVEENISFGLRMKNFPSHKIQEMVKVYLQMIGLEKFRDKYPRELSGGQRQRVGIARALAVEPEALLLDEPFSALDPLTTDELHHDLLKIWQQTKTTIVMVSHSLEEAVLLAGRIGVMGEGNLKGILDISLPRPRNEHEEDFLQEVGKARRLFMS